MPAPRSSSSHHPRPANNRHTTHARIAHRICLPVLASFAPSLSPYAHISFTALLHPLSHRREYGDTMLPRARIAHRLHGTCRLPAPRTPRSPNPVSTGTRCLPARAPRTARAALLLVLAPPREYKEPLLRRPPRTCTPEGCAHRPHRGGLALALAPPTAATSSTARARGRGALA
ncbi:hypothetical protein DFH09DRAFT_1315566 [Mycena vulgaris]|nr:hypothetical protein DFH09DRAFT_1315566 [Mycena vulgaris]